MTNTARLLTSTPNLRLLTPMPQDENESSRETPTEASAPPSSPLASPAIPPPPNTPTGTSSPSTLPPAPLTQEELDAEADAIRASLTPAGISKVAADNLIAMFQYSRRRDFDLLDPEGALAKQQERLLGNFKSEVVEELAAVVEQVTGNAMAKMGKLLETHGNDIAAMKRDIAGMKRQVKALEQKMKDLDARAPQATPPTEPT